MGVIEKGGKQKMKIMAVFVEGDDEKVMKSLASLEGITGNLHTLLKDLSRKKAKITPLGDQAGEQEKTDENP